MRVLAKNKQKMYYAHFVSATTEYEEEAGEVQYIETSVGLVPIEIGSVKDHYDMPVEFFANISSELNKLHATTYGVDQSSIYSELCVSKDYVPLTIGDLIWRMSAVEYGEDGYPLEDSADYKVMGLMTEGIHEDYYLLQRTSVA